MPHNMVEIGELQAVPDGTMAFNIRTNGSRTQAAIEERMRPVMNDVLADHPEVVAAAQQAIAGVGVVVSRGSSLAYLDVTVPAYADPIADALTDSLVTAEPDGVKQLRLAVLDERNQLPTGILPETPRDSPSPALSLGGAITSDGVTPLGLPVSVSRLLDPIDDAITDELEAGGRAPQSVLLPYLQPDGTIPPTMLPPTAIPSGLVTASITGDPSDPDVTLFVNGIEL